MQTLVQTAASLAQPWADLYGGSAVAQTAVTFLHFAGLMTAGGFALSADAGVLRRTGRPPAERAAFVDELGATHRVVLAGLAAVVVTGLLMLAADVEALLPSPVFWAKMGAFALLLLNGLVLQRAERAVAVPDATADGGERGLDEAAPERRWRALRAASVRSAGLWFAVLLLGTLLATTA